MGDVSALKSGLSFSIGIGAFVQLCKEKPRNASIKEDAINLAVLPKIVEIIVRIFWDYSKYI